VIKDTVKMLQCVKNSDTLEVASERYGTCRQAFSKKIQRRLGVKPKALIVKTEQEIENLIKEIEANHFEMLNLVESILSSKYLSMGQRTMALKLKESLENGDKEA
jgi:hypothetical protein